MAEEGEFLTVFRRACDIAYDGESADCRPEGLDRALRAATPSVVIVHADGPADRGCSLVSRVRARAGLEKIPVLAIGSRLGPLERWHLGAAGAFAVRVPVPSVDVLATVIEEALSYARVSSGAVEPSHANSHMHLGPDELDHLPIEAFLLLIAGSWSGGTLPENALPALLDAARENGHDEESLRALERACSRPIPLVDVDVTDLLDDDRWYLYAFAQWIALGVGDTIPRFSPTLQVMGFTLGITARLRPAVQALVEAQRRDLTSSRHTFRREDFRRTMLPELERVAGFSARPAPDSILAEDFEPDDEDDVIEMPDDAMIDDALVVAS